MHPLDVALFHWINGWPEWPRALFVFLSEGIRHAPLRIALICLAAGMVVAKRRPRSAIVLAMISWPLSDGLTNLAKHALPLARPCVELSDFILRTDRLTSAGTLSAHSANMAAVATIMTLRLGRWGYAWIVVAVLTGISRIYVGVHYPSQVLGGWVAGCGVALLVHYAFSRWIERKPATSADALSAQEP